MMPATLPIQRPLDAKLLVVDGDGDLSHRRRASFPLLLRDGDLVVANDAGTLPASLTGVHVPTGAPIELRLAGRESLSPDRVRRFTAIVFGACDYRTPTEHRPPPPPLEAGDALHLGPLSGIVERLFGHPRLIDVRFDQPAERIWEGLARHGRPVQYAYIPAALAIWDIWTPIASQPVAFEAPSAGFMLDWRTVGGLRARGIMFATITHAAGLSSTGDAALDRRLPFDEPYVIPSSTAMLISASRRRGGRIIAIGTTVVRALEHAARENGTVRAGEGIATQRIGADTPLQVVDAVISGVHEPGTSHFELLRAFQDDHVLARVTGEAEAHGYRAHEFGDSVFLSRRSLRAEPLIVARPDSVAR